MAGLDDVVDNVLGGDVFGVNLDVALDLHGLALNDLHGLGLSLGQGLAELAGCCAGLAGVRLVDDECEALLAQVAHGLQDEAEFLQSGHHHGRTVVQRLSQLGRVLADGLNDTVLVLELADGGLQLRVQHAAVRHHDDRIKDFLALGVVQVGQAVRRPGNAVGLAGACRVLDEVGLAWAFDSGVFDELLDRNHLMKAREDERFLDDLLACLLNLLGFQVHEVAQDFQPIVRLPDEVPEVVRGVALASGGGRIAGAAAQQVHAIGLADVERQEVGLIASELGSHVDHICGHGEVDQGTGLELQQGFDFLRDRVLGKSVFLVLSDGIRDALRQVGLELCRRNRQAVDEQDEVDALFVVERVVQLPDDSQTVLLVELDQLRILVVRRLEFAQAELRIHVLEAVPQQVQRALGVQLLCHPLDEHRLRLAVVPLLELGPFVGLGLLNVGEEVLGKDGLGSVVGRGILQMREHPPARGGHLGAEFVFEDFFGVDVGQCWQGGSPGRCSCRLGHGLIHRRLALQFVQCLSRLALPESPAIRARPCDCISGTAR